MTDITASVAQRDWFGSLLLPRYRIAVIPDWTDRNGHLNNAYYLVSVQSAFIDAMKLWRAETHLDRPSMGNFTMQSLVTHLRELRGGARLLVIPRLLAVDEKRTHVLIEVHNEDEGYLGAVIEKTSINVARGRPPRVTNFSDDMRNRLEEVVASHADAPLPGEMQPTLPLNPRRSTRL